MKKILLLFLSFTISAKANTNHPLQRACKDYKDQIQAYNIKPFSPSYQENFNNIPDAPTLEKILVTWNQLKKQVANISAHKTNSEHALKIKMLKYVVERDIKRFEYELEFKKQMAKVPTDGLYSLPTKWYELYLLYETSTDSSPEDILNAGEDAIKSIQSQLSRIQDSLGYSGKDEEYHRFLNSDYFIVHNKDEIINTFQLIASSTQEKMRAYFDYPQIKPFTIAPIPEELKNPPPAYYNDGTFYFNFAGGKFNRRDFIWSFLHELAPGHHYQLNREVLNHFPCEIEINGPFFGFLEGWGAYAEDLGMEMGLYDDYTLIGKLEWQLIRAVRMILDVRIHRDGWDNQKAMEYWNKIAPESNQVAAREINRIRNWPGQVNSYMVGANQIKKLRSEAQSLSPKTFDLRSFHKRVLKYGSVPLNILSESVLEQHH